MSLLSALSVGVNALTVNQIGLRVTGNNISNANTPGYVREELLTTTAPTVREGNVTIGLGVKVEDVVRHVDDFVAARMRAAQGDVASGEAQENVYLELEGLIGELTDTDLSTSLTEFFSTIHDIVNQPESVSVRAIAVSQAGQLTSNFRRLDGQVRDIRTRLNDRIENTVDTVNNLIEDVHKLNKQILDLEQSFANANQALGLRDERDRVLLELNQFINVQSVELENGNVNVSVGGEFVISGNFVRKLSVGKVTEDGINKNEVRLESTDAALAITSGELHGLEVARDEITTRFLNDLDHLASSLIQEFNQQYSQGQGLQGFESVISHQSVADPTLSLDEAGLPFSVDNGTLSLQIRNRETGISRNVDIPISLDGLPTDTTAEDLRAALDDVEGIRATLTANGHLQLDAEESHVDFAFTGDTSGVLSAFGINTFFTGTSAADIGVSDKLAADPSRFAASRHGIGQDVENALTLANLVNADLDSLEGASLTETYEQLVIRTSQGAATTTAVTDGFRSFALTLESQHLAISGVSLDEEAVKMVGYQRSYEAVARYIRTVNEMLEVLVNL